MPVVMARARAIMTAIFFMAVPFISYFDIARTGEDFRDRHHVLELLVIFCGSAGREIKLKIRIARRGA
jgi:hypothetical protein